MTGTLAYILAKKIALGAVSGIQNITFNGNQIIFHFNNGSTATMTVPVPKDGVSIVKVEINKKKHLICTMSDGTELDAGEIPGGTGGGLIQANKKSDLPNLGKDDTIYLVLNEETLYYWNTKENKYKAISGGEGTVDNASFATKEDIDKLFENNPPIDIDTSTLATKEDIDKLFAGAGDVVDPSSSSLATKTDIDILFS